MRKELEIHQRAILQIRKALTGDIHSTSDLLDAIAALKAHIVELEEKLLAATTCYTVVERQRDALWKHVGDVTANEICRKDRLSRNKS